MYPVLFDFFDTHIYAYGVLLSAGFFLGMWYARREAVRMGMDPYVIMDLAFWVIIASIIGARMLYIIVEWETLYRDNPWEMLKIWKGGMVFYGGVFLSIIATIVFVRRNNLSIYKVGDLVVQAGMLGLVLGRFACFMGGCCHGAPTDLPWGIHYPAGAPADQLYGGAAVHPAPIYMSLNALVIFFITRYIARHQKRDGQAMWTFFVLYPLGRSLIEMLRGDVVRGFVIDDVLSTSQFLSIPVIIVGAVMLMRSVMKGADEAPPAPPAADAPADSDPAQTEPA